MSDDIILTPEYDRRNHAAEANLRVGLVLFPYNFVHNFIGKSRSPRSVCRRKDFLFPPTHNSIKKEVSTLSSEIRLSGFEQQLKKWQEIYFLLPFLIAFFYSI